MNVETMVTEMTNLQMTINDLHFQFKDTSIIKALREVIENIAQDAINNKELLEEETDVEKCVELKKRMLEGLNSIFRTLGTITVTGNDIFEVEKINDHFIAIMSNIQTPKEKAPSITEVTDEAPAELKKYKPGDVVDVNLNDMFSGFPEGVKAEVVEEIKNENTNSAKKVVKKG